MCVCLIRTNKKMVNFSKICEKLKNSGKLKYSVEINFLSSEEKITRFFSLCFTHFHRGQKMREGEKITFIRFCNKNNFDESKTGIGFDFFFNFVKKIIYGLQLICTERNRDRSIIPDLGESVPSYRFRHRFRSVNIFVV